MPVKRIRATTTGFIPDMTALKYLFSVKFLSTEAISKITINDGKTTPKTASKLPRSPALVDPIYVARFTAIGPGVDSQTPKKL